jgi:hypothetical protein
MDMQERIDNLIKMRTEKPEYANEWDRLRNALTSRPNVGITPEQQKQLDDAFSAITRKEFLDGWDNRFMEVVIDGQNVHDTNLYFEDHLYLPDQKSVPRHYGQPLTGVGVPISNVTTAATWANDTVSSSIRREIDRAIAEKDIRIKK